MRSAGRLGAVVIWMLAVQVVATAARADLPVPFILWVDADLDEQLGLEREPDREVPQ